MSGGYLTTGVEQLQRAAGVHLETVSADASEEIKRSGQRVLSVRCGEDHF